MRRDKKWTNPAYAIGAFKGIFYNQSVWGDNDTLTQVYRYLLNTLTIKYAFECADIYSFSGTAHLFSNIYKFIPTYTFSKSKSCSVWTTKISSYNWWRWTPHSQATPRGGKNDINRRSGRIKRYLVDDLVMLRFTGRLRAELLPTVTLLKSSFLPCWKLTTTVTYTISLSGSDPVVVGFRLASSRLPCRSCRPGVFLMTADFRLRLRLTVSGRTGPFIFVSLLFCVLVVVGTGIKGDVVCRWRYGMFRDVSIRLVAFTLFAARPGISVARLIRATCWLLVWRDYRQVVNPSPGAGGILGRWFPRALPRGEGFAG